MQKHAGMPDVQSIHRRAREHKYNGADKTNDAVTGFLTNKQARKRADEKHNQVNENKRRKHIEARQRNNEFEIPMAE
eukprot:6607223-Heterocapsa_arctica.AAC.1